MVIDGILTEDLGSLKLLRYVTFGKICPHPSQPLQVPGTRPHVSEAPESLSQPIGRPLPCHVMILWDLHSYADGS